MSQDIDTTSINDLPISRNRMEKSNEEIVQNIPLSTSKIQHDKDSIIQHSDNIHKKQVRFKEENEYENTTRNKVENNRFVLTLEYKIIILSTFFFFVFNDIKFKKYILNIMVQIFGSFLKSDVGLMNKMGMFVYSLIYGLLLLCCVHFIDLSSFHLAF